MRVLAFDTADDACTLLLWENGLRAQRHVLTQRDQARILAPLTQELLAAEKLTFDDIDAFAVPTGPGSFTGLRVGLAFARGLALATGKPLGGLTHFAALAAAARRSTQAPLLILRESKRDVLYACRVAANSLTPQPFLATAEELAAQNWQGYTITGNAAEKLLALQPGLDHLPLPPLTAALEAAQAVANNTAHSAEPYYLREADVTTPKPARLA